jgi:hypothetical protein
MRRVAFACLLVAFSTIAHAQNADMTKEFQAGVDAYRLGKFDEARKHLEAARDLDPKLPGPYRFLSAVAKMQGKWDDCIANARKALELNPKSSETADTRKVHDECRVQAGRTPYREDLGDSAAVAVNTNVPGASVKINGLTYGATPLAPRPITPGPLEVEIEKPGWKPTKVTPNALAGIVTDVIVDLEPDPNSNANELQNQNQAKIDKGWLVVKRPTGSGARDVSWPPERIAQEVLPAELRAKTENSNDAIAAGCDVIRSDGDPIEKREERVSIDGAHAKCEADPKEPGALRYELPPGTHVLEVKARSSDAWRRRVRISAGQKTLVQPVLVETSSRSAIEKRGLYIVGGGSFLLATGFVAAMLSRDAANEARDIVRIETQRSSATSSSLVPIRTRADLHDATDKARLYGRISNVSYGAGLIAVGVGAYYLYKGARERTDIPPPFAIAPTRGGVFVAKEVAW